MRKREAAHEIAERHRVSANALYRALLARQAQEEPSTSSS